MKVFSKIAHIICVNHRIFFMDFFLYDIGESGHAMTKWPECYLIWWHLPYKDIFMCTEFTVKIYQNQVFILKGAVDWKKKILLPGL